MEEGLNHTAIAATICVDSYMLACLNQHKTAMIELDPEYVSSWWEHGFKLELPVN